MFLWRCLACELFCLAALFLAGCADFEHRLDVAIFGSEEKAQIANEKIAAERAEREIEQQRKMEKKTFDLINDTRKHHFLPVLEKDETMRLFASVRAKEISDGFDARRPNGDTVRGEFWLSGLIKPESVVYTWMIDIESRNTLLDPALSAFSVGVFKKGGTFYWLLVTTYD